MQPAARWHRRLQPALRPLVIAFTLLLGPSMGVGTAWAHAIVTGSDPKVGAALPGPDVPVTLTFNSRIDHARSRLTLLDPKGGKLAALEIAADSAPDSIRATAKALKPGKYILRWQVLASDGHLTRGDIPFSIAAVPEPQGTAPR